jgi:hypothetical protein
MGAYRSIRVPQSRFARTCHSLRNVPLHDVWRLDLPGGGDGRTVADIHSLVLASRPSGLVRLLFTIRRLLGQLFGWDRESVGDEELFQLRITEADRVPSTVATGTKDRTVHRAIRSSD